jgi:hypothetical protein
MRFAGDGSGTEPCHSKSCSIDYGKFYEQAHDKCIARGKEVRESCKKAGFDLKEREGNRVYFLNY